MPAVVAGGRAGEVAGGRGGEGGDGAGGDGAFERGAGAGGTGGVEVGDVVGVDEGGGETFVLDVGFAAVRALARTLSAARTERAEREGDIRIVECRDGVFDTLHPQRQRPIRQLITPTNTLQLAHPLALLPQQREHARHPANGQDLVLDCPAALGGVAH